MKTAVIVFPGSNCDRDLQVALRNATGEEPTMVWHKETALPDGVDLIGVPGGFSYGDYLRCGAIAARAPVMGAVARHAARGGLVFGVCNGWQILIEAGLLPGALMRNAHLKFVARDVHLRVERADNPFAAALSEGEVLRIPVAHHDGAFTADAETLRALDDQGRVAFRYVDPTGAATRAANPNGSAGNIAGVLSENRRVLGMMPHPERAADPALGGEDGARLFAGMVGRAVEAA
ncbi:MAG: phosphoribosylformylglycinamidine synthase subunit PurQ [Pseudomonadota bacterium]